MVVGVGTWFKQRWRLLLIIVTPLVLLPLPIVGNSSQSRCGYVVLILIIFWVSEVIPLAITALLPLALFPMAGILTAEAVAPHYFKDIIALFFGSLSLGYAVESVNLHRRIALFVLSLIGTSTKWSMAGLMGVTAFLSMWINNSAATSIMLPVALAITGELERHSEQFHERKKAVNVRDLVVPVASNEQVVEVILSPLHIEEPKPPVHIRAKDPFWSLFGHSQVKCDSVESNKTHYDHFKKGFLLSIAYSSTIGGLSTLVGTTPNVFVKGFIDEQYAGTEFRVTFLNFLLFALPVAVIMLVLCWLWLQIYYNRKELFQCRSDDETRESQQNLKILLAKQYKALGRPNWSEITVAIFFIMLILLWVTKDFSGTSGWNGIFQKFYISDGTVAILCGILPAILPSTNPFTMTDWEYKPIITWNNLAKNLPWGAILLLGAGLSIASAFQVSLLSESVARALRFIAGAPQAVVILLIIIIAGLFTEVTSNLSTTTIFLPVLDSVARSSEIHPGLLILPCALAVSLAFMLPIATPPNAIVFASGSIRVTDMIKTGIVMNLIGFLVIFLAATTWMPKIYGLNHQSFILLSSVNTSITTTTLLNPIFNQTL